MKIKKKFEIPEIEMVCFDEKDVITEVSNFSTNSIYNVNNLKDFFNVNT